MPPDHPLASPFLTVSTIDRVVSVRDVVERNDAITRGYHELSHAVAALLGDENANWLTFGQWASAEAGRAIRGASIPSLVRPVLGPEIEAAVAGGNAAVFGDVAPPFARFVSAFCEDPEACRDERRARAITEKLCSHPKVNASPDLVRAFHAYTDVLLLAGDGSADARVRRAQRMFVANVSIGAEEQRVADPYVRAAIPGRSIFAIIATAHLGIHLPDASLALDRDVPPPAYLGGPLFPAPLTRLLDGEALELAERFGQDPDSARDSDAPDWEDYRERMGFIFTFLRAYQQDPSIFALPPHTVRHADGAGS